jgi:hypothetical protein
MMQFLSQKLRESSGCRRSAKIVAVVTVGCNLYKNSTLSPIFDQMYLIQILIPYYESPV